MALKQQNMLGSLESVENQIQIRLPKIELAATERKLEENKFLFNSELCFAVH